MNHLIDQIFKNKDLLRIIYSFDPQHRIRMKDIIYHFEYENFKTQHNIKCIMNNYYSYVNYNSNRNISSSLHTFFRQSFETQQLENLLNQMIKCRCCNRHSHFKPIRLNNSYYYIKSIMRYKKNECECLCRTIGRILFFSINDNNKYDTYHNNASLNQIIY
jgi:hypothetical protein